MRQLLRLPGVLVVVAMLALAALLMLVAGPAGAAPADQADRYGLLPMLPQVALDPALTNPDHECYTEDQARRNAETRTQQAQDKYSRYQRGEGIALSAAEVNAVFMELVRARIRLVDARYALAICQTGLLNDGKGDKCRALVLAHNSLEDQSRQQEQLVQALQVEATRMERGRRDYYPPLFSQDAVEAAAQAVRDAKDVLNTLRKTRNAKLKELKADPNCKAALGDQRPHTEVRPVNPPNPNPAPSTTTPPTTTPPTTTPPTTTPPTTTPPTTSPSSTAPPSTTASDPVPADTPTYTDAPTNSEPAATDPPAMDVPDEKEDQDMLDYVNPDDVSDVVVYLDPPCDLLDATLPLVCLTPESTPSTDLTLATYQAELAFTNTATF
jgi:hypothetical protein